MLGTLYQTKLTFLANLLTFLRILLQRMLYYDKSCRRDVQQRERVQRMMGMCYRMWA